MKRKSLGQLKIRFRKHHPKKLVGTSGKIDRTIEPVKEIDKLFKK